MLEAAEQAQRKTMASSHAEQASGEKMLTVGEQSRSEFDSEFEWFQEPHDFTILSKDQADYIKMLESRVSMFEKKVEQRRIEQDKVRQRL